MQRLIFGEAIEEMKNLPDNSVDMVLADIPYGSTLCKWDNVIPFEPMWEQLKRVAKENGAIALTSSQPFTSYLITGNIQMFKYCWYWKKEKGTGFATSGRRPMNIIEEICIFYTKQPKYDKTGDALEVPYTRVLPVIKSKSGSKDNLKNRSEDGSRKYATYTHKTKTQFLEFSRDKGNVGVHPTQKPVALMEYLIETYTDEGETVLDFTCGSGSTLLGCQNTNRNGIGVDNGYCEKDKVINGIQIKGLRWVEIAQLRLDGKI